MMRAILLARDLDHDLRGLAHDPPELGPSLGLAQRRGARLPSPARSAPSDAHISPPQYPFPTGGRPPSLHEAGPRQDDLDRKRGVSGKRVDGRVALGGRRIIKKKNKTNV